MNDDLKYAALLLLYKDRLDKLESLVAAGNNLKLRMYANCYDDRVKFLDALNAAVSELGTIHNELSSLTTSK